MTPSNLPHAPTVTAEPAPVNAGFAAAVFGLRTVAFSLLVDRALSA